MIRYSGQPLPERPRIAVFANDAIGNFVMATPLLQLLRQERMPSYLHYFGGTRTQELQDASGLFDQSSSLLGSSTEEFAEILKRHGKYDLLINLEATSFTKAATGLLAAESGLVCGPCISPGGRGDLPFQDDDRGNLWRDREWIREDLLGAYPFLKSPFISEIFCRLCYLDGPIPPYHVPAVEPPGKVPDVLIATAASLPEKLWDYENWKASIETMRAKGLRVGLLGASPTVQAEHWSGAHSEESLIGVDLAEDLRGTLSLPEVVGALSKARLALTLDNGILHLAVAAGVPTVGLFRHGIHRLWAPPSACLTVLTPGEGKPVSELPLEQVEEAVWRRLGIKA